tara:strand:- start:4241 stop:4504 length:264 start_codon:yes stop_codon:yes gene_type:complete
MRNWRKELGNALKDYRKEKGWKQSDIQAKTDITRQVVSEIENGKFTGAISTVEKYMLLANIELKVVKKGHDFPQLDELSALFGEDNG